MKIFQRSLLCILLLSSIRSNTGFENDQDTPEIGKKVCHHQILQFYGLEGWAEAHRPEKNDQDGALRSCPEIEFSCCSRNDFLRSQQLWEENILNIKGYLTKIFRIIQKMIMLQSSLIQTAQQASTLQNKKCQEVDITFFNPPIPFKEVYSYLMAAFQSMAHIQKGFYCTICDAKNQPFLMMKQDFSRLAVKISEKSCNDLIYRFKEFVMYKSYYFDNFLTNAVKLFNCVEDSEEYSFESSYVSQYQEIKSCVETGNNCHIVCNEFRLGGVSDLFMGDLHKYEEFHQNFLNFSAKHKINVSEITDQVFIPEYTLEGNDFFKPKGELSLLEQQELNYGQVSNMNVIVGKDGIDLFGISENSNYFLMDQASNIEKNRIFDTSNEKGDSLLAQGVPETQAELAHDQMLEADGLTIAQNGKTLLNLTNQKKTSRKSKSFPLTADPTKINLRKFKRKFRQMKEKETFTENKMGLWRTMIPKMTNPFASLIPLMGVKNIP